MTPLLVDKRCRLTITEALCLTVAKLGNFRRKKNALQRTVVHQNVQPQTKITFSTVSAFHVKKTERTHFNAEKLQYPKSWTRMGLDYFWLIYALATLTIGQRARYSEVTVKKYSPSAGSVLGKYMYLRIKQPCFLEHRPLMYIFHVLELPIAC